MESGVMSKPTPVRLGKSLVVAIDGPSGSGKSSVSKEVARRLGLAYLDTGAMYRAVTWHCVNLELDLDDAVAVERATRTIELKLSTDPDTEFVRVGTEDVTTAIREPDVSTAVSAIATKLGARAELIRLQQQMIADAGHRMVVEGRDITTVVAPNAEVRLLLTASEEARMARRGLQLGGTQNSRQLSTQVLERDKKDSTVVNFHQAADGVVTVDSSDLDFEETVQTVLDVVHSIAD
ncbi:(d)CMP kinase [Arthrobacter pigmenti]